MPVSYTHLDVYKRQLYLFAIMPLTAIGTAVTAVVGSSFGAKNGEYISRAHKFGAKDVYKRQIMNSMHSTETSEISQKKKVNNTFNESHFKDNGHTKPTFKFKLFHICLLYTSRCV